MLRASQRLHTGTLVQQARDDQKQRRVCAFCSRSATSSSFLLYKAKVDRKLPGRYSCIGKNLALQELRCVTALLVSKYDVTFPPGEDGSSVERDTLDQFISDPGELRVIFKLRRKP